MLLNKKLLFLLLIPLNLLAIHDPTNIGAPALGSGTIGVVGTGFHAVHNNQAALAYYNKFAVGIDYDQGYFADKNLSTKTIGIIIPSGWGSIGVNLKHFGYEQYNEQKIGLAYGKALGKKLAIGVQLDYFRTYIGNDYGNANAVSFEVGIYSKLTEKLELGAHIFNPIGAEIGSENPEEIPVAFKLGLLYHVEDNLMLMTEVEKIQDEKVNFKLGIDYMLNQYLITRIGFATQPTLFTFGMGLRYKKLIFDIGCGYHQTLGFTPRVSLLFNFN